MHFCRIPTFLQNYMLAPTYGLKPNINKHLTSVTGPFPRGHATPVNPLVQLSYMSRIYNATQKLHPRDSTNFSSLGDHGNYNFSTHAAATPNQTIIFDGLDRLPTNQDSSCSQDLAQLRLCNPAGCSKWTRNIQVVRGETFKLFGITFVWVFPNKTVLGHLYSIYVVRGM